MRIKTPEEYFRDLEKFYAEKTKHDALKEQVKELIDFIKWLEPIVKTPDSCEFTGVKNREVVAIISNRIDRLNLKTSL